MSDTERPASGIFRQSALDRLQSPEQIGSLIRVVGPSGWILLLSLAFVIAGAAYWSVYGRVSAFVEGRGILGPSYDESRDIVATHAGILRQVNVGLGARVQKGQLLGTIEITAALQDRRDAERTLRSVQDEHARIQAYWAQYSGKRLANLDIEEADLKTEASWHDQKVKSRQRILDALTDLNKKGLATSVELETARDQVINASADLAQTNLKLEKVAAARLELANEQQTAIDAIADRLLHAQETLADARDTLHRGGRILSTLDGVVVEVDGSLDTYVEPGAQILRIQALREELDGVFFAEPRQGKKIREGMAVNVSPSIIERDRYGTIRGRVAWVSEQPQSESAVIRQVGNRTLAHSFIGAEPPIAFGVKLERDPATPSGLRWTSGTGPDMPVPVGTIAMADVAVKQEPPIVLLIPALRRLIGIDP
ncbi:NHLP bacteriocin system secretion protein [Xanthobacteraceae bacterium A53D]